MDVVDEMKKKLGEMAFSACQGMLSERDTRLTLKEQIYNQNMDAKDKELLSEKNRLAQKEQEYSQNLDIEKNRLVRLKEFISSHAKCVGCKKKFDTILHIPYVLTCGHTLCSLCFFNIPIITHEDQTLYDEYIKHSRTGFFDKLQDMIREAGGETQETFQNRIKAIKLKIEEQKTHLQGFEHIGKCPVCKTPQRGLRYDLLATFNAVKEFSFGKKRKNKRKSIKKSIKRKSIKRNTSKNNSKRKSIKRKSSKRKSIKRKSKRKNNKSRNKK